MAANAEERVTKLARKRAEEVAAERRESILAAVRTAMHTNDAQVPLSALFRTLDTDADGMVTKAEFRNILPVLETNGATAEDMDALFAELASADADVGAGAA